VSLYRNAEPLARQALAQAASRFKQIRPSTTKVAGFETASGRHLAVIKTVQGNVQIWIEDVAGRPQLGAQRRTKPRHSNLMAQAPRVGRRTAAVKWLLAPTEVAAALEWYAKV